jgi:hypothetical protein
MTHLAMDISTHALRRRTGRLFYGAARHWADAVHPVPLTRNPLSSEPPFGGSFFAFNLPA